MIIKSTNHQIQELRKQLSIANSKLAQEKEEHKSCGDRLTSLRMELSIRDSLIQKLRDENAFLEKALLRAIENQDTTVENLRNEFDDLQAKLDEARSENESLQAQLDECTPANPYRVIGMTPRDFQ